MLLHIPIAILTTLSPVPVSDAVPTFNIVRECGFEAEMTNGFERCSHDESDALRRLEREWPQFSGGDRSACLTEATVGGFDSYVELLLCLEMARNVSTEKADSRRPLRAQSTSPIPPDVSIVDKHE
jgi:hypothetical protein